MTLIYRPQAATIHLIGVTLAPGTSRADRSRFYKRMRQAMWHRQLIMASSEGLCMHLGMPDAVPGREREAIVSWLIEQPPVRRITVEPARSLKATLDDQFSLYTVLSERLDRAEAIVARQLLRKLLTGVVAQAINRRRFVEGA